MKQKNLWSRVRLLATDPAHNARKIFPYIISRIVPIRRKIFELFGNDRLSKPYPGQKKLLEYLKSRNGFFVEVGGNDGFFQDPTYYLEKFRGWKGIIIEPLSVHALCQKNRKHSLVINAALVGNDYSGKTVTMIDCNAMSVVKGGVTNYKQWIKEGEKCQKIHAREISVPALTLDKLLAEQLKPGHSGIDLLAIDVEGYELEVLRGLTIEKYAPRFILVEILEVERRLTIERLLENHYEFVEIIGHNDYLFKRK
jgi:FkbM family methyltransferase